MFIISWVAALVIGLLLASIRWRRHQPEQLDAILADHTGFILVFWHERLLSMVWLWPRAHRLAFRALGGLTMALFYADIVRSFADAAQRPVACYVVSGEYKMIKDYGESCGCLLGVVKESHVSMLRAGASIIITYFAPFILDGLWKREW